ncbi:MAG: flippase-like domain-containing protein [Flavobacteriaceae bacterium]|nr:flippase-like domain-containing protein [Eudoraea sp.]NNJ37873.1 flippase-like domain-containing protein [Flavobacteriaceae bacterium]
MNKKLVRFLKIILPIALGLFLVWYSYAITSETDRQQILKYIREADPFWVGISIVIGMLSHISRAIRWNYLLAPLGYRPRIMNNILIILMAYFTNLGIPRSGEVLRATALASYENVPFQKGFGTIVTERVIDLLMLLLIILAALFSQTDVIMGYLKDHGIGMGATLLVVGVGIMGLFLFLAFLRRSTSRFAIRVKDFVKGLLDGLLSIFRMEKKWPFVLHTIFIWAAYVLMFWVIKYTVIETIPLSFGEILVAFVAGAFAMSTTNGGVGLYPIAVRASLGIFGISAVSGDAFGWIMWIAQTLMIVFFGAISFLIIPLWNRNG